MGNKTIDLASVAAAVIREVQQLLPLAKPPTTVKKPILVVELDTVEAVLGFYFVEESAVDELPGGPPQLQIVVAELKLWNQTATVDERSDEADEQLVEKIIWGFRTLFEAHAPDLESNGVARVLFTADAPAIGSEQYEIIWAKTPNEVTVSKTTARKEIEHLIKSAGQYPEYSILQLGEVIQRVVLFGEAYSDKKLQSWLQRKGVRLCENIPEWRFVATRVTDKTIAKMRTLFPAARIDVVTLEEYVNDPELGDMSREIE